MKFTFKLLFEILWTFVWFSSVLILCTRGVGDLLGDSFYCDYSKQNINSVNYFNSSSNDVVIRDSYNNLGIIVGNTTGFDDKFIILQSNNNFKEVINNCSLKK